VTGAEIVRAEAPGGALALGATPEEVLERATHLADALATLVRSKGLALRLGDGERDFLTLAGWGALGAFLGVTPVVTSTEPAGPGAFRSHAEARTGDGRVVGAGVGYASRQEHRLRKHSDHSLAAMSQSRAMRRALQGPLSWIPGLAGMNVSSPDLPATRKQVIALHALASELGWDRDERHARAGVSSLNELSREAAAELLESWQELLEGGAETQVGVEPQGSDGHVHDWRQVPGRRLESCVGCGAARKLQEPPVPADDEEPHAFEGDPFGPCTSCGWAAEHPVHERGRGPQTGTSAGGGTPRPGAPA